MLDLDNFKTVNDNYGHLAGDHLLIQFGAVLDSFSREEDIICRFGGDEFAIFLKISIMLIYYNKKQNCLFKYCRKN